MSQPFNDALHPAPEPDLADIDWQPLPARARLLFVLGSTPMMALSGMLVGGMIGKLSRLTQNASLSSDFAIMLACAAVGLMVGAIFGFWLGHKQFRHTYWRLDAEGLALRRGRMWQRETRVPITRVQHLDIKRGPLQRYRNLATLTVHTAGTRNNAVVVPNIDLGDAEYLRDRLGRQLDLDDED